MAADPELAQRFRAARFLAGISVKTAAEQLGVSASTLERMERGRRAIPAPFVIWAVEEWRPPAWVLPDPRSSERNRQG